MEIDSARKITVAAHPRRPPPHLSVSLRHDAPATNKSTLESNVNLHPADLDAGGNPPVPLQKQISDDSNNSGDSCGGTNVENWFRRTNKRPSATGNEMMKDNEPPYFLQRSSNDNSDSSNQQLCRNKSRNLHPSYQVAASPNGSNSDDFRSVIDDLTVENRRLKERLRKYENTSPALLRKERLFEIKFHSLSQRKKRELEEILASFTAGIDNSSEDLTASQIPSSSSRKIISGKNSKHDSASSTSNSRPPDSAYQSMTLSGPYRGSSGVEGKQAAQMQDTKDKKMQDFLQDIPEGLMAKNSGMTTNQKKKLVVRRLEELFTGKQGVLVGEHSHSLQQQEVSKSAARADHQASQALLQPPEGVREAHIGPYDMELDQHRPEKLKHTASMGLLLREPTDSSPDSLTGSPSPEQRPTRPLDLDPDRAQIASENVDYIRHLGISAPQLLKEESADAAVDADGWIYLNLLINMAQLHIINVTPDFVRTAVADVSKKLQVSRDGKKLRWRGGTTGTHLSSDSGMSSVHQRSPGESDISDDPSRKRRKTSANKYASIRQSQPSLPEGPSKSPKTTGPFQYKPLFFRRGSSNDTSSPDECSPLHYRQNRSRQVMDAQRSICDNGSMHDDGPMVFYSGAKFFSDLSGDAACTLDRDSMHSQDAKGSTPGRHGLKHRTPSGSLLPFRPFKDCSKGADPFQTPESRPRTPDLLSGDCGFEFTTDLDNRNQAVTPPLHKLYSSGIGGTWPSDHFVYKVHTRLTRGPRKLFHTISKSSLDSFREGHSQNATHLVTDHLAGLKAADPLSTSNVIHQTVRTEIIAEELVHLEPSPLPEPASFFSLQPDEDDSETDSLSGSSDNDDDMENRPNVAPDDQAQVTRYGAYVETKDFDNADEGADDDDEDSIDMLAYARIFDPATIARQEQSFDREASGRLVEPGSLTNSPTSYDEA